MSRRFLRQTVSLGVSYTLGTFNDNFFKQAILLLAVSMGHTAVQAWGTVLFSLPFVLFSAWAGWLADRYPKCRLVLAAKALEVCAMLAGGWGLLQLHWSGMLAMLFCMGASATLFSPALNGSLPELFAREDVPRVNALFKLATTASILLGILAGYAVAFACGMVDLSGIAGAAWFSLPRFLPFGISFEPSACIALGLLFAINSIQAIGDLTATTVGGMDREPTDRELQGGIVAYGVSNILTALLGGLPTATYSQNVGIVTGTKVVNRNVFALTGALLLVSGLLPKLSALLTTIPQCVLGGATVAVFSSIAMTGMKLIAGAGLTARNTSIVGLSAALGVGISQAAETLSQFPEAVTTIFGKSPVVLATLMAVLLNLTLPKDEK